MAAAPGTTYGSTGGAAAPAPGKAPAKQAAAQRVQRWWNPRTSRMEGRGPGGHLLANEHPAGAHGIPPGHQVSHTQTTTHREAPAGRPAAKPEFSLINATTREIEARAKAIVEAQQVGERAPFQQEQQLLGREQTYGLNRNTEQFGKLGQTIEQQQNTQAGTAKTFENYAADQVNKAATATPGLAESQERLGIPAGGKLPESVQRQQEASRTLLSGIAQAAQAGTTARQQAESGFLSNMRAAAGQQGTEFGRNIEAQFGRQKAQVAGKEQALLARGAGAQGNLILKLLGEQGKLRTAYEGLTNKKFEAETKAANTRSQIARRGAQTKGEGAKIGQGARKLSIAEEEAKRRREEGKAKLTLAGRKQSADERYKEGKLANEAKKILEKHNKETAGPKLTALQVNNYTKELTDAFWTFKEAREHGVSPAQIRQALIAGKHENAKTKKKEGNAKVTNVTFINAAEEIMQKEYIGATTKAQLRAMRLPDSEWSNLLLGRRPRSQGAQGAPPILPPPRK